MSAKDFSGIRSVLATDCGSTTTKAILIEKRGEEYRLVSRGEAPTTVEAPFEDVTKGVLNATLEVEELRGRRLLADAGQRIITPQQGEGEGASGADVYISTSSAGGGLQMMVAGVVMNMTAESAQRAALGAGAIVMDALASNDRRLPHEKIERIRSLRPDMLLLSGGVDGGTVTHVVEMAEVLAAANPRPRLGIGFKLPVIYAGNRDAATEVSRILGEKTDLTVVENLRPVLEREHLKPARDEIHELFMEHVMQQAPGYKKLMSWADAPIMPTPGAVGSLIQTVAQQEGIAVLGVDIGGATTDVFSVFTGVFNRTVSANLGMSYSISNVLAEAGLANILRWVPIDIDEADLRNRIGNKMIRPTTIPQTLDELKVEQAIAREALRLAFEQHKAFAVGLKGVQKERSIGDALAQDAGPDTLVDLKALDLIIGSGGVLSHAPRRSQSMRMMIDAFLPEGVTQLAVDSIFMMPHLGVLASVNARAANEVFQKDCLIRLGACIAPVGPAREGEPAMKVTLRSAVAHTEHDVRWGDLLLVGAHEGGRVRMRVVPAGKKTDVGAGPGAVVERELDAGVVGMVLDARGRRPFAVPQDAGERVRRLGAWCRAMDEYPA